MNTQKLEMHLRNLLYYLQRSDKKGKGVVAAGVIDVRKSTYAVSFDDFEAGKSIHAERVALNKHLEKYGRVGKNAWVVTTLSPCWHPDENREGESCTSLLLGEGEVEQSVKNVYTGYIDPWQLTREEYEQQGLNVRETNSEVLRKSCKNLFQFFEEENKADISIQEYIEEAILLD